MWTAKGFGIFGIIVDDVGILTFKLGVQYFAILLIQSIALYTLFLCCFKFLRVLFSKLLHQLSEFTAGTEIFQFRDQPNKHNQ